jgi:hypothetical protein
MAYAIKRYTREARMNRGKGQRYQRKYPHGADAVSAALRWIEDPDVKAVWAYDEDDTTSGATLLYHATAALHAGVRQVVGATNLAEVHVPFDQRNHSALPAFDSVEQADAWAEELRLWTSHNTPAQFDYNDLPWHTLILPENTKHPLAWQVPQGGVRNYAIPAKTFNSIVNKGIDETICTFCGQDIHFAGVKHVDPRVEATASTPMRDVFSVYVHTENGNFFC